MSRRGPLPDPRSTARILGPMSDLPLPLPPDCASVLRAALDQERKIERALEALGPISDRDVVVVGGGVVVGGVVVVDPVQVTPLSMNDAGLGVLPVQDALKPICAEPPVARLAFHDMLVAVTVPPVWDQLALQPWVTIWVPGKLNRSDAPAARSPSIVVGNQCRRCSGSVIARQTFSTGCASSRVKRNCQCPFCS